MKRVTHGVDGLYAVDTDTGESVPLLVFDEVTKMGTFLGGINLPDGISLQLGSDADAHLQYNAGTAEAELHGKFKVGEVYGDYLKLKGKVARGVRVVDPDGGEYTTITAALAAAEAGDVILLVPGIYEFDAPLSVLKPVVIEGLGQGAVLQLAEGTDPDTGILNLNHSNGTLVLRNIVLRNLHEIGGEIGVIISGSGQVHISNVLGDTGSEGVFLSYSGSAQFTVQHCDVVGGMVFSGTGSGVVRGCSVSGLSVTGASAVKVIDTSIAGDVTSSHSGAVLSLYNTEISGAIEVTAGTVRSYLTYIASREGNVTNQDQEFSQVILDRGVVSRETAGATIHSARLVEMDENGNMVEGAPNSRGVMGINAAGADVAEDASFFMGVNGKFLAVADSAIRAGKSLKCGTGGRVVEFVDNSVGNTLMNTPVVGGNFTQASQPQDDEVEVVSSSSADTQNFTLWSTRHGQGSTVFTETIPLDGTTPVLLASCNDFERVMGVLLSSAAVGTVTVRRASDNAVICTISPGSSSRGVVTVSSPLAYNTIPKIVTSKDVTGVVGIVGTSTAYASQMNSLHLSAAAEGYFTEEFNTVSRLLVGDVTSTAFVSLQIGDVDDPVMIKGKARAAASAKDQSLLMALS